MKKGSGAKRTKGLSLDQTCFATPFSKYLV